MERRVRLDRSDGCDERRSSGRLNLPSAIEHLVEFAMDGEGEKWIGGARRAGERQSRQASERRSIGKSRVPARTGGAGGRKKAFTGNRERVERQGGRQRGRRGKESSERRKA